MKTPTKLEIVERARELFHIDRARNGDEGFAINPELNELAESGYISTALSDLMTGIENKNARWFDQKETDSKVENFAEKSDTEISSELPFDVQEAMCTGFFACGTSQSGKTNLAKHLVKKLIENGITVYVFDVSQAWSKNGPIAHTVEIFGNERTISFPVDSSIFDISGLTTWKKLRFVNQMCKYLFDLHVHGLTSQKHFLVFEEAQTYLPNGCMRLSTRRDSPCENVLNVVTVGANYKLRFGLITQFPAMVDKTPVKIAQQRYFGWTWEKNDVDYLKAFMGKEWAAKLRDLQRGQFIAQLRNKIELIQTDVYGQTHGWGNYEFKTQLLYTNTYK